MQRRFSVYMDMLESKGLGEMKRATKNDFNYKLQETFLTRRQAAAQGAYRDPNFGKASGTTVAPPEANQVKPAAATQQAAPVQPEVTADDIRAFDDTLSPEERDAINNEPHKADNDMSIIDPHGKKTDAIIQSRQPAAPAQPAPTQPAPTQPAPAQPTATTQPEGPAQPGKMDKFLSGVNKVGKKLGNFQDRASQFAQRTGAKGGKGDLSKLMQYGLFGKESQEKPEQIENLKQQLIAQGYPEDEAANIASKTVNQQPVDNQRQRNKKEQFDTLKQMYINNGYSEADAEKMAASEQAKRGTPQDQEGVSTTGDQSTGVKVGGDQSTGVKVGGATNDTLDQATISTIDQNDIDNLVTIPDDQLEAAVAAVADGHNVDAATLRKHIDAQREAISNT